MLERELTAVSTAREKLHGHLDQLEEKVAPGNVTRVAWWWLRRSSKKHPVVFTLGAVATIGIIVGLVSWALVDDSE